MQTETAAKLSNISFAGDVPSVDPMHTKIVPGQGVVFRTKDAPCLLYFDNEKVFGTHCVWLAANTSTALYPVAASESTCFEVLGIPKVTKDGPDITGG